MQHFCPPIFSVKFHCSCYSLLPIYPLDYPPFSVFEHTFYRNYIKIQVCFYKKLRFKNIFFSGKYLYKQRVSIKPPYGCKAITILIYRIQQSAYQLFFIHLRVKIGLQFPVLQEVLESKVSRQTRTTVV